jgi:hypothetical protein
VDRLPRHAIALGDLSDRRAAGESQGLGRWKDLVADQVLVVAGGRCGDADIRPTPATTDGKPTDHEEHDHGWSTRLGR